jgi:hypothetical protein
MDRFEEAFERVKVHGRDLADKIRELLHEGNVRRIIVKDESGHTYLEIPLTVASIGVIAAPVLAAIGALAALVARFDIVIERARPEAAGAQPSDDKGTRAGDAAGAGEHDAPRG